MDRKKKITVVLIALSLISGFLIGRFESRRTDEPVVMPPTGGGCLFKVKGLLKSDSYGPRKVNGYFMVPAEVEPVGEWPSFQEGSIVTVFPQERKIRPYGVVLTKGTAINRVYPPE